MQRVPDEILLLIASYLSTTNIPLCGKLHLRCLLCDETRAFRLTSSYNYNFFLSCVPKNKVQCMSVAEMCGKKYIMYDMNDPLEDPLIMCAPHVYFASRKKHPLKQCICDAYSNVVKYGLTQKKLDLFVKTWKEFQTQIEKNQWTRAVILVLPTLQYLQEWIQFIRECGITTHGLKAFIVKQRGKVKVHWLSRFQCG